MICLFTYLPDYLEGDAAAADEDVKATFGSQLKLTM